MKKIILLFVATLITSLTITAQNAKYSFSDVYNVTSPNMLNVKTSDGDIAVASHDKSTIEVFYQISKRGKMITGSKEEILSLIASQINIEAEQSDNQVDVQIKEKSTSGFRDYRDSYHINIKVLVPSDTKCDIVSSDGDLLIKGLKGDQKCKTSDGDIAARNLGGNLKAVTSDGDISLKNIKGDVRAVTSDGDITAKNVLGEFDGHTSDGEISRK